jgi:hypothetical protein
MHNVREDTCFCAMSRMSGVLVDAGLTSTAISKVAARSRPA